MLHSYLPPIPSVVTNTHNLELRSGVIPGSFWCHTRFFRVFSLLRQQNKTHMCTLIQCAPLAIFLNSHFPVIRHLLGPVFGVSRSLLNRSLSRGQLIATVTGHDLLVHCLSALYLGGRGAPPEMLLEARLRAISRKAPAVARLLRTPPPSR